MLKQSFLFLSILLLPVLAYAQNRKSRKKDYLVTIQTTYGPMQLVLYDQTPKHKENFITLVERKFYDSLLFHRVIPEFMMQGGDPNSKTAKSGVALGNGSVGYTVPAEILPDLFHKKGSLAAARDNNPAKASSGCQFYVVQGKAWSDEELKKQIARAHERAPDRQFTDAQRQTYKTTGGTPHLDGSYTVFGEVIDGLVVVDSVTAQPRDAQNRPLTDLRMTVTGAWIKKKKITKRYGFSYK